MGLSPETHSTTSPHHRRSTDASRSAEYEDWLWDTISEPWLYIVERDHAPIAHLLHPRSSPEQISTQPHYSLWFDYCTTEDTDSTVEHPDILRVNRNPLYVTNHISTFLWDHNEVRSAQINSGSDTGRRPRDNGPYGTHQDPEQEL